MADASHYCVVAGEPSGDQHAAALVAAMQRRSPQATFSGVAGSHLRAQGVEQLLPAEQLAVMGFSDVLRALPRLVSAFKLVRNAILKKQPTAVILVDYPGFNLRLARSLRRHGYKNPIIQYISPSVWAWGTNRKKIMEAHLDLLLTIYPFEKKHFANTKLSVAYVGNPVAQSVIQAPSTKTDWRSSCGIPAEVRLLGIFPGSRLAEVQRNLPLMLEASRPLSYALAISAANAACENAIITAVTAAGLKIGHDVFCVPRYKFYTELMADCRAALAKSGTVTLELALHHCPTVVLYQLTALNRMIARYVLRLNLPHYCIVNIIAEATVFPEFIAQPATPQSLRSALVSLLEDGSVRADCIAGCQYVRNVLAEHPASERAAALISETVTQASMCMQRDRGELSTDPV
jgi:lipid-A-disaccharide synthase